MLQGVLKPTGLSSDVFQVLKMDVAEKDLMQFLSEEVFIALTSLKM